MILSASLIFFGACIDMAFPPPKAFFFEGAAKTFLGLLLRPIFMEAFSGGGVGTPAGGDVEVSVVGSVFWASSVFVAKVGDRSVVSLDFGLKSNLILSPGSLVNNPPASSPSAFSSPVPFSSASNLALSTCSSITLRSLSSSPLSCLSFFLIASCLLNASGLLSIQLTCSPLSVSSTLHNPSLPKCLAYSVRLGHLVAFMCTCSLFAIYS